MTKRLILLFTCLSIFLTEGKAQTPKDNPCEADVFCNTVALDVFSNKLQLPTKPKYLFPKGFCGGSVDAPSWFRFIADSATLQLRFNYSNCGGSGQTGFQAAIFGTTSCSDSAAFTLMSNCLNLGNAFSSGILTANNLVIGQTYYIFVDGLSGSICDYNIDVLAGKIKTVGLSDLAAPTIIYGPTEICNLSNSAVFSIPRNANANRYNFTVEINGGAPLGGQQLDSFYKVSAAFTPIGIARITANYINNCSQGPTTSYDVAIGTTTTIQLPPINLNFGQNINMVDTVFSYGTTPLTSNSVENLSFARPDMSGFGGCDTLYKVSITRFARVAAGRVYFLRPGQTVTLAGVTYTVTSNVCTPIITPGNDTIYNGVQIYTLTPNNPNLNCSNVTLTVNNNAGDSCANVRHFKTNSWYFIENGVYTSLGTGRSRNFNSITTDSIAVIVKDSVVINGRTQADYTVYIDTLKTTLQGFGSADTPPQTGLINNTLVTSACQGATVVYKLSSKTPLATTYTWSLLRGGGTFITAQGDTTITVKWGSTTTRDTLRVVAKNTCLSSIPRDLAITLATFPNLNAGADDSICGFTTSLRGVSSGTAGNWTSVVGNPAIPGFQNSASATTFVTVSAAGTYKFAWTETNGSCSLSDTVSIIFNPVPIVVNGSLKDSCSATRTQAYVRFNISGGTPPYAVFLGGTNTVVGTVLSSGGQFQSAGFTPGAYAYDIKDTKKCNPTPISGVQACSTCNTNAGVMQTGALSICEGDTAKAVYLGSSVLEPDDTLQFVLHTGDPKTGIIARSYVPKFTYQAGINYGVTYYISAIAGNKIANNVDLNDGCFSATSARVVSVVFNKKPTATMTVLDSNLCKGSCTIARFSLTGQAPYTLTTKISSPTTRDSILNTTNPLFDFNYCPTTNGALRFFSVKDASGCVDSVKVNKTVNFTIFTPVNAGLDTALTVCEGIDTTLNLANLLRGSAAGGAWTETSATPSTGGAFSALARTFRTRNQVNGVYQFSYIVKPTLANSPCPADTAFVSIKLQFTPKADAGADDIVTCSRPIVIIGGNTPISTGVTIQWSSVGGNLGGNAPQQEVSQADKYIITASAGGCVSRDTVIITADTISPRALITPVSDSITCRRDTIGLNGTGSSPAGIVYLWSYNGAPYDNNPNTIARYGGTYMLTVAKLSNGCIATDSINIKENRILPTIFIEPTQKINCKDSIITLNALSSSTGSPYTITWKSAQGGHFKSDSTTYQPKVDSAGVYTLIITDARNGCSDSISRLVIGEFDVPKANAFAADSLDCYHPTINLSARGTSLGVGLVYTWIANPGHIVSGNDALIAVVDEPGTYIFVATNEKTQCSAVDTVKVFRNDARPQDIAFTTIKPMCYGEQNGSLNITTVTGGTAPYLFSLDGKVYTPRKSFSNLIAGAYKLYVQDASGCVVDSAFNLVQDREIGVSLGLDTILKLGDSLLLQVGVNIPNVKRVVWSSYTDSTCRRDSACMKQWVKPVRETTFKVAVTDANGCKADGVINIKIDKTRPVFIPDAFTPNNDGTNDIFMIHGSKVVKIIKRFQIYDRWGELISNFKDFTTDNPAFGWDGKFRGKDMLTGAYPYFIEVEYLDGKIDLIEGSVTLVR